MWFVTTSEFRTDYCAHGNTLENAMEELKSKMEYNDDCIDNCILILAYYCPDTPKKVIKSTVYNLE